MPERQYPCGLQTDSRTQITHTTSRRPLFTFAKDIANRFGPFYSEYLALRPLSKKQLGLSPVYLRVGAVLITLATVVHLFLMR